MLLELAREEVPSLYNEVDITSNKQTNKQLFGFKSTWHVEGVVTSQDWVLG